MADIFISYARNDKKIAKALAKALEEQGWTAWWDAQIPTGSTFDQVLLNELKKARLVLVIWSEESIKSRWVKEEAEYALVHNKFFPVITNEVVIPPFGFRQYQAHILSGWDQSAHDEVLQRLLLELEPFLGAPPVRMNQGTEHQIDEKSEGIQEDVSKPGIRDWIAKGALFIAVLVCAVLTFPTYVSDYTSSIDVGMPWSKADVIAPFAFPNYKPEDQLERERRSVRISYFEEVPEARVLMAERIDSVSKIYSIRSREQSVASELEAAIEIAERLVALEVIDIPLEEVYAGKIFVLKDSVQTEIPATRVVDIRAALRYASNQYLLENPAIDSTNQLIRAFFGAVLEPNLHFVEIKSKGEWRRAEAAISEVVGRIEGGEVIVKRGQLIDSEIIQRLKSLEKELVKYGLFEASVQANNIRLGLTLFALLALGIYLFVVRRALFPYHRKTLVADVLVVVGIVVGCIAGEIALIAGLVLLLFVMVMLRS